MKRLTVSLQATSECLRHHSSLTVPPRCAGPKMMFAFAPTASHSRKLRHEMIFQTAAASSDATTSGGETFTYQAEVDRLMDMIVNSLYSNREIFIRELISNASDALDKIRLLALQEADQYKTGDALEIRIKVNKDEKTIVIEDTGIGMTKDELVSSLGTIARSGTAKFMEAVKESHDANLIGQFGVGFYSAFLVADRVTVQTKSNADATQWAWESTAGAHSYTVYDDSTTEHPLSRGTRITLHLKDDATDLADQVKLSQLIKQYSEFISFPIKLWMTKQTPRQEVDDEATKKKQEEADAKAKEEGKEEAERVTPVYKTEWDETEEWSVQNDNKPLWTRPAKEVTKEEYGSFFKTTFREFADPLAQAHFNVEGTMEFSALLFVPSMPPFEQDDMVRRSRNIRLFVKRVFISDEFDEDLMPRYLSFIKGVVDSADLPLNVSREILQESRIVRAIRRQLVKRSLDMIAGIAARCEEEEEEEGKVDDYTTFWEAFGKFIKLGVIEDSANKDTLTKLLRFPSSQSGKRPTSLAAYKSRAKEGQPGIYYLAADSQASAEASPYVETLVKRGYEVLFLTEPIDEVAISNIEEFEGMKLLDVSREDLALDETEEAKAKVEAASKELAGLTDYMKSVLTDKVEKVVVTSRLAGSDTPAVVVSSKFGWSANMERIMKAQALGDARAAEYMRGRRIMEINPDHPVIAALADSLSVEASGLADRVRVLYDAAALTGGFTIDSPKDFAARVYTLLSGGGGGGGNTNTNKGDDTVKHVDAEIV